MNGTADIDKLLAFGFERQADGFVYEREISEGQFRFRAVVNGDGLKTTLFDVLTEEPYTLHLVEEAQGAFVASVRAAYREVLDEIERACFPKKSFQGASAQELIDYVRQAYGDELEYLWEKSPQAAVLRRKDNRKWYAILMVISKSKLGSFADEPVSILDLRMQPEKIPAALDGKTLFPGYHMNKQHWITVLLDGSVPAERIFSLLDESYRLARGK